MGHAQGHSFFCLTSLSCALSNSVSYCETGRLAGQIFLSSFRLSFILLNCLALDRVKPGCVIVQRE